jgi:hypothetical protein
VYPDTQKSCTVTSEASPGVSFGSGTIGVGCRLKAKWVRNGDKVKGPVCTVGWMTDRAGLGKNFSLLNHSSPPFVAKLAKRIPTSLENPKATASRRNEYGKNERISATIQRLWKLWEFNEDT